MTLSLPWPFPHSNGSSPIPLPRKRSLSVLLRQYETPGVYPSSARVDPTLKLRENEPLRLWDVWKYGAFVASKGEVVVHDPNVIQSQCSANNVFCYSDDHRW
jgi:hypothetical protein